MYFDNAATTMVSENVLNVVNHSLKECYANAGSIHSQGIAANKLMEDARNKVAEFFRTSPNKIIFTSGGSESNSLAIIGLLSYLKTTGKTKVITSSIEHPSVLKAMEFLSHNDINVISIYPDRLGHINIKDIEKHMDYSVGLVSIMAVNNELGSIQNISEIGEVCKAYGVLFHTDCVQAIGTIDIDVEKMNIDLLSISGHKFHATKGSGILYAKNKELLSPIIFGGDQEFGLRAGTENVPAAIGLATALNDYKTLVSYTQIKKCFVDRLKCLFKEDNIPIIFNGDSETNESKIVNIRFKNIDGQTLLLMLDSNGVYVSAGSACKSHSNSPSHVLKAIGLSDEEALSSIRISFSMYNTIEEVLNGADIIHKCVKYMVGDIDA